MTTLKTVLAGLTALIALAGCGGDDNKSGGTCGPFTPCGGNVVGTWDVKDSCIQGKITVKGCPTASTAFDTIKATGTMTFKEDLTGSATIALSGAMKMNLPLSCLGGANCAATELALKAELAKDANSPFTSVTCTGTDPCNCAFAFKGTPMMDGGSYSTAGTVLSQGTDKSDYCVAGNELKIRSQPDLAMPSTMMSTDDLTMTVTLTKK